MNLISTIRSLDNGQEKEPFDIEVEDGDLITFVSGCIHRFYAETWGGSYLMDREKFSECVSKYIEIQEITTLRDGEEIKIYDVKNFEKLLNGN